MAQQLSRALGIDTADIWHISSIYMKTGSCRILTRRVFISSTIRRCTIICARCG